MVHLVCTVIEPLPSLCLCACVVLAVAQIQQPNSEHPCQGGVREAITLSTAVSRRHRTSTIILYIVYLLVRAAGVARWSLRTAQSSGGHCRRIQSLHLPTPH